MNQNPEINKKNAIEFYKMAYEGNPRKAVELFVGSEYIQHNPLVGDGIEPFISYFEKMAKEYPDKDIKFVRAVAEGNMVALHTHQKWPEVKNTSQWIFSDLTKTGKWLSIGIRCNKFLKSPGMGIPCISI